jgi:thymidine phosphorylase
MAGLASGEDEGHARALRALHDGSGLAKLAEVVRAQGGDADQVLDPSRLPRAPHRETLCAPRAGFVARINAERIGMASVHLGAGRMRKGDPIDYAAGLVLLAKVGDRLDAGDPLVEIHARSAAHALAVRDELLAAYTLRAQPPTKKALLLGEVAR